jgi:arylsulfatase A-like enzyme
MSLLNLSFSTFSSRRGLAWWTRSLVTISVVALLSACTSLAQTQTETEPVHSMVGSRPNIIFILADDLGSGDISALGQKNFQTPNLDRMLAEGLFLSQHYSGSTVCAPSRAALMTGNHTGRLWQRGNFIIGPPRQEIQFREDPLDLTIATRLQAAGYHTALIGKSPVSCNGTDLALPNKKGFDHFFGFVSHRAAHRHYPDELIRNGEVVHYPSNQGYTGELYAGDLFLDESLRYLEGREDAGAPFFLHLAISQPHADLSVPAEFEAPFIGRFDEQPIDSGNYVAAPHPKATYAAMVTYIDHTVRRILQKLRELGIEEDTLVIFSSDNGSFDEGGYHYSMLDSNAPFRGGKRDLYEGAIRVPTIAWWPGTIAPGSRSDHISAFWDFPATALELAGLERPESMDGISYLPSLLGQETLQESHRYLYWEFHARGGRQALRYDDWKGVRLGFFDDPNSPLELYNLREDPAESTDLAAEYPAIVEKIDALMREAHTPHDSFPIYN